MFFKHCFVKLAGLFRLLSAVTAGLLVVSCGLNIGEKAPQDKPIVISGCPYMSHIGEEIDAFFNLGLKDQDILNIMGCIRSSIISFKHSAVGKDVNTFSAVEIRNFLHQYFIKDRKISDQFLADLMVLKQTMMGGPSDHVTSGDLARAVELVDFFSDQLLILNRYMSLYNFDLYKTSFLSEQDENRKTQEATKALQEVARHVGEKLSQATQSFPLDRLESLLIEVRHFSDWNSTHQYAREPRAWVELLSAFKDVVTGSKSNFIDPKDWPSLLVEMANWYSLKLKLDYVLRQPSLFQGQGLLGLQDLSEGFKKAMVVAVEAQPHKIVTFAQINVLIDKFEQVRIMPPLPLRVLETKDSEQHKLSGKSLKAVIQALLARGFSELQAVGVDPDLRVLPSVLKVSGLDRTSAFQCGQEIDLWFKNQNFLIKNFLQKDSQTKNNESGSDLAWQTAQIEWPILSPFQHMVFIAQKIRPVFLPGQNQIYLSEHNLENQFEFYNLSMMNVVRGLISLLMKGYSHYENGTGVYGAGLTEKDLQTFYQEFRDFGVELQLFDPRVQNTGLRVFREANLFTYSGHGIPNPTSDLEKKSPSLDDLLTFPEAMEVAVFNYSGGMLGRKVYSDMMDPLQGVCARVSQESPRGVHDYFEIDRPCFTQNLISVLLSHIQTMPSLRSTFSQLNGNEQVQVAQILLDIVDDHKSGPSLYVDWNEVTTMGVVLHYVESIMTRYDTNQNGILDENEIWKAYETFKSYMERLVGQKLGLKTVPLFVVKRIFGILIRTGQLPSSLKDLGKELWSDQIETAPLRLTRLELIRLFRVLSQD